MFLHETFRTGLVFPSWLKWVQIVVCYDQNLQKHKYLSGISTFLHKTFRTGLVFLSWLKWFQIVVCYDWNLQKHKYLSWISMFLHKTFRIGLIFPSRSKWVQIVVWSKFTKTEISQLDINVSARNLRNRAHFSEPVEISPNSGTIETYKNRNIWVGYQCFCTKPSEQGLFFRASQNDSK